MRINFIRSVQILSISSALVLTACGGSAGSGSKDPVPSSSSVSSVVASSVVASSVASSVAPSSSSAASTTSSASSVASSAGSSAPAFTLASTNHVEGATINSKYTCDGTNINPQLHWDNVPEGTKSFAVIMDDPDALAEFGQIWVHWNLFNIPGTAREITEGASPNTATLPVGATEAATSFGSAKYGGPCPPSGRHKYFFAVYALNKETITYAAPSNHSKFETDHASEIISKAYLKGYFR